MHAVGVAESRLSSSSSSSTRTQASTRARSGANAGVEVTREQVDAWWADFRQQPRGSARWLSARAKLLEQYRPMLRAIAAREGSRLPSAVEIDDLVSAGTLGLIRCMESFDPGQNSCFEAYCAKRVRGAMVDYLRSLDWHPRLTQRRHRRAERQRERFRVLHGREPMRDELLEALRGAGHSTEEADLIVGDSRIIPMGSLFSGSSGGDGGAAGVGGSFSLEQSIGDERQVDPFKAAARTDLRAFIGKNLSRSERLILYLYYYESLTMREIGEVLGKSESRVSQMHLLLIQRLKSELAGSRKTEFA